MTNLTSDNIIKASNLIKQKVPLIPPASIRTSTNLKNQFRGDKISNSKQQANSSPSRNLHNEAINMNQSKHLNNNNNNNSQNSFGHPEMWSSVQDLFWDHMREVQNKWNTLKLNDDIWAKLIYFEQNRRLAKAYVSAPVLTVDGSTHGLDGFRIGLSGIDNSYRSLDSMGCLRSIGLGIKLKIDHHGNILIRKIATSTSNKGQNEQLANSNTSSTAAATATNTSGSGQCSVWIKEWPTANSRSNTIENCMMREIEQSDVPYKLFDMKSFRSQLERKRLNNENNMDWRQCVSIISFVRSSGQRGDQTQMLDKPANSSLLLEDPCWIMLINIIAIDMLKSSLNLTSDDESSSSMRIGRSSLIQNHQSLMESGNNNNNRMSLNSNSRNTMLNTTKTSSKGPHRTSSSSSILFPSGQQSSSSIQGGFNRSSSGTDTTNTSNLVVTSERLKKLRTSNNNSSSRNRLTAMKNGAHHRRYQSIQQLSSSSSAATTSSSTNSTIYTTFNGKFANNNNKQQFNHLDTTSSSTSDYNSGSRSINSSQQNYWRHQQQQQHYHQSHLNSFQHQPINRSYNKYRANEGRAMFSRKSLLPSLDSGNKSLSLSTFDLSQRRFDLRSMHSSIRMNYDYLTEAEDNALDYEDDDAEVNENNLVQSNSVLCMTTNEQDFEGSGAKSSVSTVAATRDQSPYAAPTLINGSSVGGAIKRRDGHYLKPLVNQQLAHPKLASSSSSNELKSSGIGGATGCCVANCITCTKQLSHEHVNHNECQATQGTRSVESMGSGSVSGTRLEKEQTLIKEHQPNVISGSSIASSSSSSGCADNDYFMSHSSSSMSSSASNERELFSQPASSSGIIGSAGSTSDEYDEGGKKLTAKSLIKLPLKDVQSSPIIISQEPNDTIDGGDKVKLENVKLENAADDDLEPITYTSGAQVSTTTETQRKHKLKKTIVAPVGGNKKTSTNNRKSGQKKMLENPNYSCDHSLMVDGLVMNNEQHQLHLIDGSCDKCPTLDYTTCNCCPDCYTADPNALSQQIVDCACGPITIGSQFNSQKSSRLSRSSRISSSNSNLTDSFKTTSKKKSDSEHRSGRSRTGSSARISSLTKIDDVIEHDFEKISTIPMQQQQVEDNKNNQKTNSPVSNKENLKHSGSWLEKRRYTKIFPKFMFSSSSSNNNNNNNSRQSNTDTQSKDKSNYKKNVQSMVRLTRSTQDLS